MSVRDLPEDVHRRLADRANPEGRSLQRNLVAELTRMADRMTPEEFVARVETNDGGRVGLAQAVDDLDQLRNGE